MATYDWASLKQQWEHGQIDVEQAIGQLLQWGEQTHKLALTHERQRDTYERQIADLAARVAALEGQRPAPKGR